jgi:hypothetical protein
MRAWSVLFVLLFAAPVHAQGKPAGKDAPAKDGAKGASAEADKSLQPGPVHQWLKTSLVGSWTIAGKSFLGPDKTAQSSGTADVKAILGDRFFVEEFTNNVPNMGTMHGSIWFGYDNMRKHATAAEIDDRGTTLTVLTGNLDEAKKTLTFTGPMWSNMSNREVAGRLVVRVESDKKHTIELYSAGPDGKEQKRFENVYTRKP